MKNKLHQFVNEGITHIPTLQKLLKAHVKTSISKSIPESSRSFFPYKQILYNHVLKYTYQERASKIDQLVLEKNIEIWQTSAPGNFYYRWHNESLLQTFMFCYQSNDQQYLLKRHGAVVLLNATYKTTKYSLPLFSLVVKTNVGFIICGMFIIILEDAKSIAEALNVFKQWNNNSWNPEYFVVDYSEAEINAIESVFSESVKIHICEFHREQAWLRWFKNRAHINTEDATQLLKLFRKLAHSKSEEEFEGHLEVLCKCQK